MLRESNFMKQVNIVFCTDKNYAKYLSPLIESILRNTSYICNFYVVFSTINEEDRQKLNKTVNDFKTSTLYFIKFENINILNNASLSKYAETFRGGYDTYSRLFLTELLLPLGVKKCVYFDIDIIVKGNIDCLFDIVENVNYAYGVIDSVTIKNEQGSKFVSDTYINAGVLVLNLEKLKTIDFAKRCLDFLITFGKEIKYMDQDCINYVLGNKYIETIDQKFNEYLPSSKKVKNAVVLHFTGPFKPWMTATRWRLKKMCWAKYNIANKLRQKNIYLSNFQLDLLFKGMSIFRPVFNLVLMARLKLLGSGK